MYLSTELEGVGRSEGKACACGAGCVGDIEIRALAVFAGGARGACAGSFSVSCRVYAVEC